MNRYDEAYIFRKATVDDVDSIMSFIKTEWNEKHILANDKDFFMWQYGRGEYNDDNSINFILMTDKDGHLLGIIGYIPYDNDDISVSPAMTKVKASGLLPMTGLEFMKREMRLVGEKNHFASGTNTKTILPLYSKCFHHDYGFMQQYYILNSAVESYKIAYPKTGEKQLPFVETGYKLKTIQRYEDLVSRYDLGTEYPRMIYKSPEYIKKRFFDHPIYEYQKWFVEDGDGNAVGILFGREIHINGSKVLRLVDFRGNPNDLCELGSALHEMMTENDYEYIDLVVSDMSSYDLGKAGFKLLDFDGETIIPNYFEPFEQRNIKNCYQTNSNNIMFKADGDQDRPNHR